MSRTRNPPLLLEALQGRPVAHPPVWLMRQAGRYLPEYRELRAKAGSFMGLATNPELACEVTLQPIRRFGLDAAILFSDILTIPDAMGLGLEFLEGEGPVFQRPVRRAAEIHSLSVPDPEEDLGYVIDAVRRVRRELAEDVPLIGFSGSPWTIATYMVEGGKSADFSTILGLVREDSALAHRLLGVLRDSVIAYLRAQRDAGAQVLMVFDTWGNVLGQKFEVFSLAYMKEIVHALEESEGVSIPVILFSKGASAWLEQMADTGAAGLGVDWTVSLEEARRRVGHRVALQGNLNPQALLGSEAEIRSAARAVLDDFGAGPGHIFNLGHGVVPTTPPESVAILIDTVRGGIPTP